MTPPVWVVESAERFWAAAGGAPPGFPRDLAPVITDTLPLSIVERAGLGTAGVTAALRDERVPPPRPEADRPLRAALYCWRGVGFLFVDSADPPEERRFSLAHELAHYLADYEAVRRRAAAALGPAALEVLDGARPASADERVAAALLRRPLTPHLHLMGRDDGGRPRGERESLAEARADRLAYELLAPAALFETEPCPLALAVMLTTGHGLPPEAALRYAALLRPARASAGPVVERLGRLLRDRVEQL